MFTLEQRNMTLLDYPKRLSFQNPDLILPEAGLKPGQIADIGCETGFFTFPLVIRVGENSHVNAIDTLSTMLKKEGLQ